MLENVFTNLGDKYETMKHWWIQSERVSVLEWAWIILNKKVLGVNQFSIIFECLINELNDWLEKADKDEILHISEMFCPIPPCFGHYEL